MPVGSIFDKLDVQTNPFKIPWTSSKQIGGLPKEIYFQYHSFDSIDKGKSVLPLPFGEIQTYTNARKLSMNVNEKFRSSWNTYLNNIPNKPYMVKYPSVRALEFRNFKIDYNRDKL